MLRRLLVQSLRGAEMIWKNSGPYGSGYAKILVIAHAKMHALLKKYIFF